MPKRRRSLVELVSRDRAEIFIYEPISDGVWIPGIDARRFSDELDQVGNRDCLVRIHSEGGCAFTGMHMHDRLRQLPGHVTTRAEGLAASAASVILMAGQTIEATANSFLMIHEPMTGTWGDVRAHRSSTRKLEAVRERILEAYGRGRASAAERAILDDLVEQETYLTIDEARELGLVDVELEDEPAIAATLDLEALQRFARNAVPAELVNRGERRVQLLRELGELDELTRAGG